MRILTKDQTPTGLEHAIHFAQRRLWIRQMVMNHTAAPDEIELPGRKLKFLDIAKDGNQSLGDVQSRGLIARAAQMLELRIERDHNAVRQGLRQKDGHSARAASDVERFHSGKRLNHIGNDSPMDLFKK